MSAAEALKKARATMECESSGIEAWERLGHPTVPGCATKSFDTSMDYPWGWHRTAASVVLDGFSVEELTEVGG